MIFKLFFYGGALLLAMVGWSWVRTLRHPWARRHRGTLGWILSLAVMFFLLVAMKMFLPKI